MRRTLRMLLGLLLLPLCWGATQATLDLTPATFTEHPPWVAPALLAMASGHLCWLLVFMLIPPPVRTYIWAHELTHAFWGFMTGARVGRIRVSATHGSVSLSHAGVFTTLAPYFVPFYTVLVIVLRLLLAFVVDVRRADLFWMFLIGATWGFHMTFTLRSVAQRQPDILTVGRIFSYALIYLVNLACIGYGIVAVTDADLATFHDRLARRGVAVYAVLGQAVGGCASKLISQFGS